MAFGVFHAKEWEADHTSPSEQPAFSTWQTPRFLAQPHSQLEDLQPRVRSWNRKHAKMSKIPSPMLWKEATAIHPQSKSPTQSINPLHRGIIVFVTLSSSWAHLSTSTWTHIPQRITLTVQKLALSSFDISDVKSNGVSKCDDGDSSTVTKQKLFQSFF